MKDLIKLEYEHSKQTGLTWMFLNGVVQWIYPEPIKPSTVKQNTEDWIELCCEIGVDHARVLKSAMDSIYTEELVPSLLSGLDKLDLLDAPYNVFYTFILIMYARTRYELFPLRRDVRFAVLDSMKIGWQTVVEENNLDQYITRCSDYVSSEGKMSEV